MASQIELFILTKLISVVILHPPNYFARQTLVFKLNQSFLAFEYEIGFSGWSADLCTFGGKLLIRYTGFLQVDCGLYQSNFDFKTPHASPTDLRRDNGTRISILTRALLATIRCTRNLDNKSRAMLALDGTVVRQVYGNTEVGLHRNNVSPILSLGVSNVQCGTVILTLFKLDERKW